MLTHAPPEYKQRVKHRLKWATTKHHYQITPRGDWLGWVILAGRGSGKTRTGAEDCVDYILTHARARYAIVAPTYADARDICIEGESGVKAQLEDSGMIEDVDFTWNRSIGELKITANDSYVRIFGSLKPNRLRGPQWHRAWLEELAAWDDATAGDDLNTCYNNLMLGLRLGADPRYIVTTTPKPVKLVRELVARDDVVITRGSSYDNLKNLAPKYHEIIEKYEGTRIGRQEIMGVLLEDVEGALWTQAIIDDSRWRPEWGEVRLREVYVGADPSGSATAGETGIIAAGSIKGKCPCGERQTQQHYAVIRDCSKKGTAMERARAIVTCFDNAGADKVVGERNYGGDNVQALVAEATEGSDRVPYEHVNATRGKEIRAEPVSSAYEQLRVHHVGEFVKLEEQQTTWEPDAGWSPDRLDAMVWAITKLQQRKRRRARTGKTQARLPERIG